MQHLSFCIGVSDQLVDLDKQSLSYASVYGLITDLDVRGNRFAWTSSIFYVGKLASEFPFIYLMSRSRLSKFVGITMSAAIAKIYIQSLSFNSVVWGTVCMYLDVSKTYDRFFAVRCFLGAAEGVVSPLETSMNLSVKGPPIECIKILCQDSLVERAIVRHVKHIITRARFAHQRLFVVTHLRGAMQDLRV